MPKLNRTEDGPFPTRSHRRSALRRALNTLTPFGWMWLALTLAALVTAAAAALRAGGLAP
ncbi:MAG: hypothetical protein QNJ84_11755 [Alphaproteobacteria bacterium]|nr:hypothetical protein [Alphaproteobacteria bacterium]